MLPEAGAAACPPWLQSSRMLWLKAFHVVFMVTWFAGLFYLPRLFVYHVAAARRPGVARASASWSGGCSSIMTIGALATVLFGLAMVVAAPAYLADGVAAGEAAAGGGAGRLPPLVLPADAGLRARRSRHSQRWYRFFNELPGLLLDRDRGARGRQALTSRAAAAHGPRRRYALLPDPDALLGLDVQLVAGLDVEGRVPGVDVRQRPVDAEARRDCARPTSPARAAHRRGTSRATPARRRGRSAGRP